MRKRMGLQAMKTAQALLVAVAVTASMSAAGDLRERMEHKYANSDGVRIHYAMVGDGPLVVMLHGFPDFWYSWRKQMTALEGDFRVAALDLRGYNRSDKPQGVQEYEMSKLVGDVAAVIKAEGEDSAVVVGHDWGGAIAWNVAMFRPELVRALVILNLPHPAGLARELMTNPQQRRNSQYARDFQQPDAHKALTAEGLAFWVTDEAARAQYVAAFERSDFAAMLNYYKANYPRTPPDELDAPEASAAPDPSQQDSAAPEPSPASAAMPDFPKVQCPVLMFHGLDDQALLPGGLNDTWNWVEKHLTLVTIPGAGHFVQQDASDLVSATMVDWLRRLPLRASDATKAPDAR